MKTFYDSIFNNIFACFRLGCFMKNNPTSDMLSDILDYIMNYEGKIEIQIGQYDVKIVSEDFDFCGWNANKYYAWMGEGHFKKKDGKTYSWKGESPSWYMMAEFRDWLREYQRKYVNEMV